MEDKTLQVVKKIKRKYNEKEKLLLKMIEKSQENGYNIEEAEILIEKFEKSINCY